MEVRTSSNTAEMSTLFIWMGLAAVIGVLVIGPLFDIVNGMLLLTVCLVMLAVSVALAPTWRSLPAFHTLAAVATGFFTAMQSGEIHVHVYTGHELYCRLDLVL